MTRHDVLAPGTSAWLHASLAFGKLVPKVELPMNILKTKCTFGPRVIEYFHKRGLVFSYLRHIAARHTRSLAEGALLLDYFVIVTAVLPMNHVRFASETHHQVENRSE
jgi:hypothetical protein